MSIFVKMIIGAAVVAVTTGVGATGAYAQGLISDSKKRP